MDHMTYGSYINYLVKAREAKEVFQNREFRHKLEN